MKYIPPEEFSEQGFLQEINRTWLHPLGMALEADSAGGVFRIRDRQDAPVGPIYPREQLSQEKHDRVEAFREFRREARLNALGYVKQPIPHQKKTTQDEQDIPSSNARPGNDGQRTSVRDRQYRRRRI